ncbi:MAG: lysophospholipid acyltransferase family protein [Psychrilyobacter sp.]|uniref:lysophospholipid acyltransferase family protein n=1 Tax=Psychrilyobacter sp. TaxID=2586924 RepID=UPI003C73F76E
MKEQKKYKIFGLLIYYILRVLSKTYKVEKISAEGVMDENAVYVSWHNKIVPITVIMDKLKKKAALASASKDGELISVPLEKFGYKVVRGSSGRDAVKGLLKMVKFLKDGYIVGTPVDGPKGPVYKVKPGMLFLAQRSGKKLVPIGAASKNKWVFKKTWDKIELPKPFSKIVCILGKPISIAPDEDLNVVALRVEKVLLELDRQAEIKINKK